MIEPKAPAGGQDARAATPGDNPYRARDLLLAPSLLSLSRLPLAGAFPFAAPYPAAALGLLAASGVTDVLDGFVARRFGLTTPIGAIVDGATDKVFVTTVIATLALRGDLTFAGTGAGAVVLAVALLFARELGELPLVMWFALSSKRRLGRPHHWAANMPGKVATLLQFVTVSAAMLGWRYTDALYLATALAGAVTAALYWRRTLSTVRDARPSP
jgi:cardiolipin synthase (CMP-forming)